MSIVHHVETGARVRNIKWRWFAALMASLTWVPVSQAQTFTWNATPGGFANWNVGSSWVGGVAPTGLGGEQLVFGSATNAITSTYQSNNTASFIANRIDFNSQYGYVSFPVAINDGGGGTLSIEGPNAQINQLGSGNASFTHAFSMNAPVNGNVTIGGIGVGNLAFSSTIFNTGNNVLTFNQQGTRFLNTGAIVSFSNPATFGTSGSTVITNGNVMMGTNNSFGFNSANTITINTPTSGNSNSLRWSNTTSLVNDFVLNDNLNLVGTSSYTITLNGVLSGAGGIRMNNASTFGVVVPLSLVLTNANSFSGDIVLSPRANSRSTLMLSGTTGSALNVSNISLNTYSSLSLDNASAAIPRLNSSVTLNVNNSNLIVAGNQTTATAQGIGIVNLQGQFKLAVHPNSNGGVFFGGAGTLLSLNTINRTTGTLYLAGSGLGQAPGAGVANVVVTNNPGGAIGGILPYAQYTGDSAGTSSPSLVRWDAGTGRLTPLDLSTDYQQGGLSLLVNRSSTANYVTSKTQTNLDGARTVNGLVAPGVSLIGSGTLHITSGAIVGGGVVSLGGVNLGSATGNLHQGGTYLAPITGSGGVVSTGSGTLTLAGSNTFTGGLTVLGNSVLFSADNQLGAANQPITLSTGAEFGLLLSKNIYYGTGQLSTVTINRPVQLNGSGGYVGSDSNSNSVMLTGTITGTGALMKGLYGTVILNPTSGANTFSGNVVVANGVLAVQNDAAMGTGSTIEYVVGNNNGSLKPLTSFSTNRNLLLNGVGIVNTSGQNLTINGQLGTQLTTGSTFIKVGQGDLILTGSSSYNGAIQSGALLTNDLSGLQMGGRLILSGPDGALSASAGILSSFGGQVVLDNSVAVNNNRLSQNFLSHTDGQTVVLGNTSADVRQPVGQVRFLGSMGTITLNQPTSAGGQVTSLSAQSFAFANGSIGFIRGNNLGAASGDRTQVLLNGAVANTFQAGLVGGTTTTAAPTEFLTTGSVTNNQAPLQIFSAYGAFGGGSLVVTDITTAQSQVAAFTNQAARLSTGGSINLAGFNYTLSSGMLLTNATSTISNSGAGTNNLVLGTNARIINNADLTIGSRVSIQASTLSKIGAGNLIIQTPVQSSLTTVNVGQGTLTLSTAGALPTNAAVNISIGATLNTSGLATSFGSLAGQGTLNINNTFTLTNPTSSTFYGNLVGSGTITMSTGGSILTLFGNNAAWLGNFQINTGQVQFNAPGSWGGASSSISLNGQISLGELVTSFNKNITLPASGIGTFQLSAPSYTTISSAISLGNSSSLKFDNGFGGIGFLTGVISGNGKVTTAGNFNFSNNNTYSGGTDLTTSNTSVLGLGVNSTGSTGPLGTGLISYLTNGGGYLRADGGARTINNNMSILTPGIRYGFTGVNDLNLSGTLLLANGGAAAVQYGIDNLNLGVTTLSGVISSPNPNAGIQQTGHGVLVLSAQSSFGGGYLLSSGILGLGADTTGTITSGPIGTSTLIIQAGGLRAVGGSRTIANSVDVTGDFLVDGSNPLNLTGTINLGSTTRTISTLSSANTTFSNLVSGGGGIVKEGAGTLVLSRGAGNTYSGGTTINNGKLLVNSIGSATGTGSVTVNSGGRLGVLSVSEGGTGLGNIAGSVTVNAGGELKAGNSVGKLQVAGVTMNTGATFLFEILGVTTPGVDYSQLISTSLVTLNAPNLNLAAGGNLVNGAVLAMIRNDSNLSVAGTFNGLPEGATFTVGPFQYQISYMYNDPLSLDGQANDVAITLVSVPEPWTLGLIALGALGASGTYLWRRRQATWLVQQEVEELETA